MRSSAAGHARRIGRDQAHQWSRRDAPQTEVDLRFGARQGRARDLPRARRPVRWLGVANFKHVGLRPAVRARDGLRLGLDVGQDGPAAAAPDAHSAAGRSSRGSRSSRSRSRRGWAVSALDVPHDRGERRRDVVRGAEGVVRAVLARRLLIRWPVRVALVLPRHAPS